MNNPGTVSVAPLSTEKDLLSNYLSEGNIDPAEVVTHRKPHVRLDNKQKKEVLYMLVHGVQLEAVATRYNVSVSTAANIRRDYIKYVRMAKNLHVQHS